ncbi:DUF4271 domain-containing protein [Aquimarina gracilis]|uniref:DUF4271 domain-containing protein n=1 Tax=Aquimarina gracilis TaxID=874422 RepID=A0ABU6A0F8_9FLAO|nr:DUF4271 domain-containing protein [Aquimarina gracilis]MEB3347634.1 DUF4271 domain-containing protein [Aquimarina gracilis]
MEIITREILSTNWLTILFLISLGLLVTAKGLNSLRFSDFMMLFNNNKYIISYQKPNKLSSPFNAVLLILQIASASLFIFLCLHVFELELASFEITLFFKITIVYGVTIMFKLLVEKIVATIFSIDDIIDEYLFYKISYRNFMGVILLPINIVFVYALQPTKIIFIVLFALLLILNLIVLISFYRKNENVILNHLFYFILYLCALEIAPYFILYKLIK